MQVILTGERGVGKSQICRGLAENLRLAGYTVGGIWTETRAHGSRLTLTLHDLETNAEFPLADTQMDSSGTGLRHGRFIFNWESIYAGIKSIGRGVGKDLLIVDEIGSLELQNQGFFPVLHTVRRARHSLFVVRPELIEAVGHLLKLDPSYEMALADGANREQLLADLTARFRESLQAGKWS